MLFVDSIFPPLIVTVPLSLAIAKYFEEIVPLSITTSPPVFLIGVLVIPVPLIEPALCSELSMIVNFLPAVTSNK